MDALQYYGAQGSGDSIIYGGMQDNGSNKVFTDHRPRCSDDHGHPITVSSVQVFGGDGGYTLVDPDNSNNVITEYTGLTALKSTDGGANWHFITPADPTHGSSRRSAWTAPTRTTWWPAVRSSGTPTQASPARRQTPARRRTGRASSTSAPHSAETRPLR